MARGAPRNFTQMDYVYFDPATGEQLAIWQRGKNRNPGASLIFWLSSLHFGYDWGLAIKIRWAIIGCALPIFAVSGVSMYWNRSLQKKWRQLMDATKGASASAWIPRSKNDWLQSHRFDELIRIVLKTLG